MLKHMDPIKQLRDTGITKYKLVATIRYLDKNMQWNKLISPHAFSPALQYNPTMEVCIKLHMAYKIKQNPALNHKLTKMSKVFRDK